MPVTAPERNARDKPLARLSEAAWAVRTLALTENQHASEAREARQECADQKAEGLAPADQEEDDGEDHRTDDGDGRVLAAQVGLRPLLDRSGNLAHTIVAGGGPQQGHGLNHAVKNRQEAGDQHQLKHQTHSEKPPKLS